MRYFNRVSLISLGLAAVLAASTAAMAAPLSTGFTYQGMINQNGQPFNGTVALRFSLWDGAGAGVPPTGDLQIGVSETIENVTIVNGLFTVLLNYDNSFGPSAFDGEQRWLQIEVCADPACVTVTILSPRQLITGAPYALGPWNPSSGHVIYNGSGNVGIGTDSPNHKLRISGGPFWTSNGWEGAVELDWGAAIVWNGFGTNSHFGIGMANGGLHFLHSLSAPGSTTTHAEDFMTITNDGRVGVGTIAPGSRLQSEGGALVGLHGSSTDNWGVYGSSVNLAGVYGHSDNSVGIYATSNDETAIWGVAPLIGVLGTSSGSDTNRSAIRGDLTNGTHGYAGLFNGTVLVSGALIKNSGSFKIDHPLDPENKFLSHSFIESPDMMNIYNGNVTTGADGRAEIELPDYFEALNMDFRYQLTVLDETDSAEFVQAKVVKKIANGRFTIRSSAPRAEVSWQVTGIRRDAWANAHRIVVEEDKAPAERGKFITPAEFGQPREKGIHYLPVKAPPVP